MARIQDGNSDPILDDVIGAATLLGLNDEVNLTLHGPAVCAVSLVFAGWTGTVVFEGSVDGSDYFPIRGTRGSDGLVTDQPSTDGAYYLSVGGLANIRTRVSAFTAGSVSCAMKAGQGSIPPAPASLGAVDQGAGGDPNDPWVALLVDGDGDPITDDANDALRVAVVSGGGGGTQYDDGDPRGAATGTLAMGDDGANVQAVKVSAGGVLAVQDDGGSLTVDSPQLPAALVGGRLDVNIGAPATLPVSAAALPLPTGAATSALQTQPGVDIGDVTVNNAAGTNPVPVQGNVAHDAAVAGNPVLLAARANTNEPATPVADGDSTHLWADLLGRLVVIAGHPNPNDPASLNATANGNTTVIAAPGVGQRIHVCKASVHNRAGTARVVALTDGAGGTVRWRAEVGSNGGGSLIDFGDHGWALTANTALVVNLDAAGDVDVNITEYYVAP